MNGGNASIIELIKQNVHTNRKTKPDLVEKLTNQIDSNQYKIISSGKFFEARLRILILDYPTMSQNGKQAILD